MRLPFQKRDPQRDPRSTGSTAPAPLLGDEAVDAARTTARRRLIGALVLLAAAVLGFPLFFETQPRPPSTGLPTLTAQGEPGLAERAPSPSGAQMPLPPPTPSSTPSLPVVRPLVPVEPIAGAATPSASPNTDVASSPTAPPQTHSEAASASSPAPATTAAVTPAPIAAATVRAPRASAEPTATDGRFTVQVGAYADATMLRETRQKVEKLGLRTYTQVIEGDAGKRTRVRVGPFATRAEAQAAAAKLKAAGLPANLLTL